MPKSKRRKFAGALAMALTAASLHASQKRYSAALLTPLEAWALLAAWVQFASSPPQPRYETHAIHDPNVRNPTPDIAWFK
jgi:hypothetical protein